VACEWIATDTGAGGRSNPTSGALGPCTIPATGKQFNDELITITIHLADDYTCAGDSCWFRFQYDYTGQVKDSTTWAVYIDGDPIRIVE